MIRKIEFTSLVSVLLVVFLAGSSYGQQTVVVQGGTLIDGNGGTPLANATILIEGDRIREIRVGEVGSIPPNARVIDAQGKFIIPGLQDPHSHYRGWEVPFYLYYGVTTVYDIGSQNPTEWILAQREMFQKEKIVGPRLYSCVVNLYGHGAGADHPGMLIFETVEEARKLALRVVELKADCMKTHGGMDSELFTAVAQVARENGLQIVGHIPRGLDAFQGLAIGVTHFEHSNGVGKAISKDWGEVTRLSDEFRRSREGRRRAAGDFDFFNPDPAKEAQLIKALVQKGAYIEAEYAMKVRDMIPRKKDWVLEDLALLGKDELAFVPNDARFRWLDYSAWALLSEELKSKLTRSMENRQKFIVRFAEAGGKVIIGAEAPSTIPGLTTHRQMQLLVDAGMPPMKAIQAATKTPAEMMRKLEDMGTLEAGKFADLLILDGNPLQDITNTQKIAQVIKGGKIIERRFSADWRNPIPTSEPWLSDTISNNPTPVISEIEPPVAVEGDPDKSIRISGNGFRIASVVYVGGNVLKTTFKSTELLEATLPQGLLAQVGTYPIQVINPEPIHHYGNAGESNKVYFIVKFR